MIGDLHTHQVQKILHGYFLVRKRGGSSPYNYELVREKKPAVYAATIRYICPESDTQAQPQYTKFLKTCIWIYWNRCIDFRHWLLCHQIYSQNILHWNKQYRIIIWSDCDQHYITQQK